MLYPQAEPQGAVGLSVQSIVSLFYVPPDSRRSGQLMGRPPTRGERLQGST